MFGAVFLGVGWMLLPRRPRLPPRCLRRADLPRTFAMLDRLAGLLGGPPITAVTIEATFKAHVHTVGRDRVLGLGALLWRGLDGPQRLALLAHEQAHLVNGDPARGVVLGAAQSTLEGWYYLFTPSEVVDEFGMRYPDGDHFGIFTALLSGAMRVLVEIPLVLLERLSYFPQQRAEYLADALSARVAGIDPMRGLLRHLALAGQIEPSLSRINDLAPPRGLDMLDTLAGGLTGLDAAGRERLMHRMQTEHLSVDGTHPPTAYRLAFLDVIPATPPQLIANPEKMAAIDAELAPHFARLGDRVANTVLRQ